MIKIIGLNGLLIEECFLNSENLKKVYNEYKNDNYIFIEFKDVEKFYNKYFKENFFNFDKINLEIDTQNLKILDNIKINFPDLIYNIEFLKNKSGIKSIDYFNSSFLIKFNNNVCYSVK